MIMIHTCLRIRVPDWCTHLSYFPPPFQWPTRDDTNNILSCSENKSNEFRKIKVQKEWKNNQGCPCKINTSSPGPQRTSQWVTRSSYRLIQNLFIGNWDKWPTRPDPESEECCDGLSDGKSSLSIQRFLTHICSSSKMFSL